MTLAEMIREVRDMVGDEGELFSDALITRYLNDAQRELAELARVLTVWQVAVPGGAVSAARPSGLARPKEAYWERGQYRWRLCIRYGLPPEHSSVTGDPEEVYVVGSQLYLYPAPSQDGTLVLAGVAEATPLVSSSQEPELAGAERAMVAYAVWKLLAATEGTGAANVRAAYEDYLRLRNEWSILEAQRHPPAETIRRADEWW